MATQNKPKPAATFRSGSVKATVWMNAGDKGPFYTYDLARSYKDAQGQWKNSRSFGLNDTDAVLAVSAQAKQWIADRATN